MPKLSRPAYLTGPIFLNEGERSAVYRTLPDGKVSAVQPKRTDTPQATIIGRAGITHLQHQSLGNSFEERSRQYILPGPGTARGNAVADYLNLANEFPPSQIDGDQFGEGGPYWVSSVSEPARAYYRRRREIATRDPWNFGAAYRSFGSYGSLDNYIKRGWQKRNPLDFRGFYASVEAARTSCSYFTSGTFRDVGANVSLYSDYFDYFDDYFSRAHSMEIMKLGMTGMGVTDFCPLFSWGEIENVYGNGVNNGTHWLRRTISPAGTVTDDEDFGGVEHPQCNFSFLEGCNFGIGFVRGDGVIGWTSSNRYNPDPNVIGLDDAWLPDVPGTPPNQQNPGYPRSPQGYVEAWCSASDYYCSMNRTEGQKWNHNRYRMKRDGEQDFGPWIEPASDGATTLEHAAAGQILNANGSVLQYGGRADLMGRLKGRFADYFVFDPKLGKHQFVTYQTQIGVNGPIFTERLQGGVLHVFSEIV